MSPDRSPLYRHPAKRCAMPRESTEETIYVGPQRGLSGLLRFRGPTRKNGTFLVPCVIRFRSGCLVSSTPGERVWWNRRTGARCSKNQCRSTVTRRWENFITIVTVVTAVECTRNGYAWTEYTYNPVLNYFRFTFRRVTTCFRLSIRMNEQHAQTEKYIICNHNLSSTSSKRMSWIDNSQMFCARTWHAKL